MSDAYSVEAVLSAPMVDGRAGHWTLTTVYSDALEPMNGSGEDIAVDVCTEVPRNDAGEAVTRRGNRYYPTTIDVQFGKSDMWLHPADARTFARMLLAAADAADACDMPDSDHCGHWAPCDCEVSDTRADAQKAD